MIPSASAARRAPSRPSAAPARPHVMLIGPGDLYGGVETFISTYAEHLRRRGEWRVSVALFFRGRLYQELREAGVDVHLLTASPRHNPLVAGRLYRLLRREKVDIIHAHGYKASILAGPAAFAAGIPAVKTEHAAPEPRGRWDGLKMGLNTRLEALFTERFFDTVVYVNRDLARRKRLRGRKETRVIYNGVPAPAVSRRKGPAKDDRFHIGIVGRVSPVKNHAALLAAVSLMPDPNRVHLDVIGEGPLVEGLQDAADRHGLADRVTWHGFLSDALSAMADLDAVAIPSLDEGLPYSLLEAMHVGVPIVAAAVGGMKEVLTDGHTALLVPPSDAGALASALTRLVTSSELRQTLAENARRVARDVFEIGPMSEAYGHVYRRLLRRTA